MNAYPFSTAATALEINAKESSSSGDGEKYFMFYSSMHAVSTAAQSTTIIEASQSKGQK